MSTAQEDVRVRIQGIIDGLPQFKAFSSVLQEIKTHGTSKVNLDTSGIGKNRTEVGQLSQEIQKLAAVIETLDSEKPGRLAEGFHTLLSVITALAHVPAAFEGISHLRKFVSESPAIAAKLGVISTAFRTFVAGAREKGASAIKAVKDEVGGLLAKLPSFGTGLGGAASGLVAVGAGGTVAAGGLLAVLGPIALIVAAVAALAAVPVVAGILLNLANSAAETGAKFHDLNQQTGVSVELLSSMAPVLEDSNGSMETFAKGVGRFNKLIGEAASGSKEAIATLKEFDLGPKEALANTDAALEKVIKRILALPPGTQQAIAAQKAFGKSGAELIPTLIATGGNLDAVKQKAIQLGVYWTHDGAAAADEYGDKIAELKRIVEGLGQSIGRVLIPELVKLLRLFTSEGSAAASVFTVAIHAIELGIKGLVRWIMVAIAALNTLRGKAGVSGNLKDVAFGGSTDSGLSGGESRARGDGSFVANLREVVEIANRPSPDAPAGADPLDFAGGGGKGGGAKKKRNLPDLAESIFGVDRASADAAFNLFKDAIQRQSDLLREQLEKRKISIKEFYAHELKLQTDNIDAELKNLGTLRIAEQQRLSNKIAEIEADTSITDAAERQRKIAIETNKTHAQLIQIDEQVVIAHRNRAQAATDLKTKEGDAFEALRKQFVQLDEEVASFEGVQSLDAIVEKFRPLVETLRAELANPNISNALRDSLQEQLDIVLKLVDAEIERTRVANILAVAEQKIAIIEADIATILAKHSGNVVEEYRARLLIKPLLEKELKIREEALKQALAMAESQQDPKTIEAIKQQIAEIARLKKEYQTTGRILKDTFINASTQGIEDFLMDLDDVIARSKTIGEAFRSMALSIIQSLQQVIAKMFAVKLMTALLGLFGGQGNSTAGGGILNFLGGGVEGKAAAGDEFFARPGGRVIQVAEGGHDEMVVTTDPRHAVRTARLLARFIRRTGILPKFAMGGFTSDSILAGISDRLPRFAMGDFPIGAAPAFAGGAGASTTLNQKHVHLWNPRHLHDEMRSSGGEDAILHVIDRNAAVIRRKLKVG